MSDFQLHSLIAFALVGIGLHALIVRENLLRKIIALNVTGAGVFLLLVAISHAAVERGADPVPQALVLTGIVVTVSVTAFALALLRLHHDSTGSTHLPDGEDSE
jgi:multicomponent Na+:H+ antiporter subunit C